MIKSKHHVKLNGLKHLVGSALLIFLAVILGMTGTIAPLPSEWDKTYGGTEHDVAFSLVQTSDGGYALAGYTSSYGIGIYDFWLVKTDSSGRKQWDRTYGGAGAQYAYSVVQTSDGGYALAGFTTSYGAGSYDFWLVKTDSSGNLQWNKTYGGTSTDVAYSLIQTSDGGYALAGYTNSQGAGLYDFWLVKTDSTGTMQWNRAHGGARHDQAHSLVQTGDGGYILAGSTQSYGAGNADFWLVTTDEAGYAQWNRTYGGANNDYAYSVAQSVNGGYALAGYTNSFGAGMDDFWLVKTDSAGTMQWNKTYGGANPDKAFSLIKTVNGGYALAGPTNSTGAGKDDFWLVKTDSSGNAQFNRTYGGINSDVAYSLVQTGDDGYALAGYTDLNGAGSCDFWLVKLAPPIYHDVAITNVTLSKTVVGRGYSMSINVTLENQGSEAETFQVTIYANTTIIQAQGVTLTSGGFTTIRYIWNTAGVAYGNYVIAATAEPVLGETEVIDNTYPDGSVLVTIPGDINGDMNVNILDVSLLSAHWYPGPPIGPLGYDSSSDINNDGAIDIVDVAIVSANWGKTAP